MWPNKREACMHSMCGTNPTVFVRTTRRNTRLQYKSHVKHVAKSLFHNYLKCKSLVGQQVTKIVIFITNPIDVHFFR